MNYSGFSLVESLVIISIIAILTSASVSALPAARAHQELISDTEQIRSLLTDAKQRAVNQVRPEECIAQLRVEQTDKAGAACSDVGIALTSDGNIVEFANTNNPEQREYTSGDYNIVTLPLATSAAESSVTSILFFSEPPTVFLHPDGRDAMTPDETATIILRANNGEARKLTVHQFGTIDVESYEQ